MHVIKDLIIFFQRHHHQPLRNAITADKGSKLVQLYDGIAKNKYRDDREAAIDLYGETPSGSKYRKLKSDLREKLITELNNINVEESDMSDYQRAYYECYREWTAVKLLIGQNVNTAAAYLAHRLLKQTEKFDFTVLSMDITAYLRIHYSLREGDEKKIKEYSDLNTRYREILAAESQAEEFYAILIVQYVNKRSAMDHLQLAAINYYNTLQPALEKYKTYRLHMYGRMIGLLRLTAINDNKNALDYCDESIRFFNTLRYEARVPLQVFYYQSLESNIQLRRFEDGREVAEKYEKLVKEGTYNWFKFKELLLNLHLYTGRYEASALVMKKVLGHARFEFLPENNKEIWRVYEAYICWLIQIGYMHTPIKQKFKLARFINEMPIFSKDKSGVNVAIVIVKFIFLLTDRKFGQLLDEVESLEQYCYRYLRGEQTRRSYYFIKMLLQIPLSGFDLPTISKKSSQYREKLDTMPQQVANQTYEMEIIPYEQLWTIILEIL